MSTLLTIVGFVLFFGILILACRIAVSIIERGEGVQR